MKSFISPPSRCHRRRSFRRSCELQVVSTDVSFDALVVSRSRNTLTIDRDVVDIPTDGKRVEQV